MKEDWDSNLELIKSVEGNSDAEEDPVEKALLDGWDAENCLYYWQREGLFLCWLVEIRFKEEFETAREVYYRVDPNKERSSKPRRSTPLDSEGKKIPRCKSPLKNEILR